MARSSLSATPAERRSRRVSKVRGATARWRRASARSLWDVEAIGAVLEDRADRPIEDRLEDGAVGQVVGGADEVQGAAQVGGAHELAAVQGGVEGVAGVVGEAAPQADVRRARELGLHAAEARDGGDGAAGLAAQEQLAGEGGPAEGALRDGSGRGRHGRRITRAPSRAAPR
jgi:hypothetical protein